MTFQALDFTLYGLLAIPFAIATPIFGAFAVVITAKTSTRKEKIVTYGGLAIAVIMSAIFGLMNLHTINENREKATSNIAQKYDVKEVDWKSPNTTTGPLGTTREGKILLTANNGEKYVFQYEVKKKHLNQR